MKKIILVVTLLSVATGITVEKWHKSEDDSLFYIDTEAKVSKIFEPSQDI